MEPWQSWAIVGVVGAGAYVYYARSKNNPRARGRTSSIISQAQRKASEVRDDSSKRRKKGKKSAPSDRQASDAAEGSSQSVPSSEKEKNKKRKGGKNQPTGLRQSLPDKTDDKNVEIDIESEGADDDEMDNKEFAKQLSRLKAGTSLNKSVESTAGKKTKKQGKRNETLKAPSNGKLAEPAVGANSHELSNTSSTTGADADDDLSPATSPALGPNEGNKTAGDVSDMLQAPAKGPSVLRLTQPTEPQVDRQPKQKKAAPEPETKKQRQNRRKNEEKKAAQEEAENERRVLLEKQRRTAREAEGRAAKNGLGGSKPPGTSAWEKPADASAAPVKSTAAGGSLLDTFDETPKPVGAATKTETKGTTGTKGDWDKDVPSEEEQMRMLSELDDDGWNTVQKGGKTKKKPTVLASEQNSDTDGQKAGASAPKEVSKGTGNDSSKEKTIPSLEAAPAKPKVTKDKVDPKIWNRSNIHNHPDYDPEFPYALTGHPDDSDWAVV